MREGGEAHRHAVSAFMSDHPLSGVASSVDESFIRQALQLAERGRGRVSPNPLVGCVVVRDGEVVGEGWHRKAGQPHAEAEALGSAGAAASGATVYVTLEPCNHHGRTPPCTEALISAGVARVVVAALDPNPKVNGEGLERLRQARIQVVTGVLEEEAHRQNEAFRTNHLLGRPFVLYKSALSLDGKIAVAGGAARWISSAAARALVHEWRNEHGAVAVGVGTVLADDPALTTRLETPDQGRTPVKVIFDSGSRTPPAARLFEPGAGGAPAQVLIVASEQALARDPEASARVSALQERGATIIEVADQAGRPDLKQAMQLLLNHGVTSILLEGGGRLAAAFLRAELVDRLAWFLAPILIGGNQVPGPLGGPGAHTLDDVVRLTEVEVSEIGGDLLVTGRPDYPVVLAGDRD